LTIALTVPTLTLLACAGAAAATETQAHCVGESPDTRLRWQGWTRVSQLYLSEADSGNASLTGLGFSLRLRLWWVAVEAWMDVYRGHDQVDTRRTEYNVGFDFLFYLNPEDSVQLFGLGGVSGVTVTHSEGWADELSTYHQFQVGLGLQFRLTRRLALDVNAVALTRFVIPSSLPTDDAHDPRKHVPVYSDGLVLRAGTVFAF